ncbi:MAG: FtsX-like permease family protein, partial [Dehalococcoidia bacterium]
GVPMTGIMVVLLVLLAISLSTVAYVIARNRIMFMIGLRNIPRRPAQTILIIIGLMLSTLIISAALTTGDTVDRSLTAQSYRLLGNVDMVIQRQGEDDGPPNQIDSTITMDVVEQLRPAVAQDKNVDGFLPVLFEQVPVEDSRAKQQEPRVTFVGVDANSMDGFQDDITSVTTGDTLDIASLSRDEVLLNKSLADKLDAQQGDSVQVFVKGNAHTFTVADIVEDHFTTGVGDFGEQAGLVTRLDTLQEVFERPGEVSAIAISNKGDVRGGLKLSDDVKRSLSQIIKSEGLTPKDAQTGQISLSVYGVKQDLVDSSEEAGNFMTTFFVVFGLFSIASGMLLIVMIFVMLAAERKSELGMARAVGTKRGHLIQMFMSEGMTYNVLAAMVGAGLGVLVAFGIALIMGQIFGEFFTITPHVTLRSVIVAYSVGVVLTFLTVTFASWRASNLNIVRAIRDIPEPSGGRMGRRWLAAGLLGIILGALFVLLGLSSDLAFPFALGFSLIIFGGAIVGRFFGFPERPTLTTAGMVLLVLWGFTAGNRLEFLFGQLNGDIEMFFLSGVAMVTASTFVLVYNADLALLGVSRMGDSFSSILPAIRTAIAYPLANKFRTGMTLAMISLVTFALTMMSAMNTNFNRLFLDDSARGGWDVVVDENPSNPIGSLSTALNQAGSSVQNTFRAEGTVSLAGQSEVTEVKKGGKAKSGDFTPYPVFGASRGFALGGDIPLRARAVGFESDRAVWEKLANDPSVALIDSFSLGGGFNFGGDQFTVSGIDRNDNEFDPITIEVRDPITGKAYQVQVIGVIDIGASASFFGIYINDQKFTDVFGAPLLSRHLVSLRNPDDAKHAAREIEASLLSIGAQADSLKKIVEDNQALFRNFFLLMQGFVALGLFVGIAAVGVTAFRTVVERRQQIGMLRAVGYKRSTVALSFVLESSFVTLLGILSGVGLAIWLSFFLVTSDEFPAEASYVIPWFRILMISGFAMGATLVMTFIPSRQAASVPIAEALRYE